MSEVQKRKPGRPKGSRNKTQASSTSAPSQNAPTDAAKDQKKRKHKAKTTKERLSEPAEAEPDDSVENAVRLKWDDDLIDSMVSAITDDSVIKQGLFPSPGTVVYDKHGNQIKSNSKPKSEYHWLLAKAIFENHSKYGDSFKAASHTAGEQAWWKNKIKNKLDDMIRKVNKAKEEMGETGNGLTSEEQIDMSLTNGLTTKWAEIKEQVPYFFEMKALLGERPNLTPVGLGNSSTDNDTSFLLKDFETSSAKDSATSSSEDSDSNTENVTKKMKIEQGKARFGPKEGKSVKSAVVKKGKANESKESARRKWKSRRCV
ncbi:hypothetical protein K435DRAFT_804763 [Dendrothele bispora CBS 962.96]|uniref:Uncharacterized protein n=1 Tax=Dendrothele bispora (strain CBS 962.96) TaxID=1314807 RepID=A0A4V4HDE2_DENBC|nr:hypothetical protein K435DRAFT_804763 [Dendrothele bispora CBS 962.96]